MALFQITALFMLSAWGCACGYVLDNNSAAPDGIWFRPDYAFDPAAGGWLKYHIMPTTWLAAQQTCFYEGAYLASPINEHMFTALRELLQKHHAPTLYTGVHSWYSPEEYLSEEGVDLIEMPLEWAEGEPNNHNNTERCLAIFQPGLAADVDCDQLYPFVCYKRKDRGMHMTDCWNTDPDYKHINKTGNCYKLHKESKTWPQAHRICMAEGGHLAIIDDQTEAQEIWKSYHSQSSHIEIHIGLRLTKAGWTYVDGNLLEDKSFKHWRKNEPNNVGGEEECVEINLSGAAPELNDLPCSFTRPFLCEINKPKIPAVLRN